MPIKWVRKEGLRYIHSDDGALWITKFKVRDDWVYVLSHRGERVLSRPGSDGFQECKQKAEELAR